MKIRVLHVASGKIIDIDATWSFERNNYVLAFGPSQVVAYYGSNAVLGETFTTRVLRLFEDHVLYEHEEGDELVLTLQ